MSLSAGTITGVSELRAKEHPGRKAYLLTVDFTSAYTGSTDTASIAAVGATILAHTRNGKTVTLQGCVPIAPGYDTNAQAVYFTGTSVQAGTVSSDALTGQLSNIDGTELTTATACKGVEICVIVKEV
jgi:hypothetical protein